MTNINEKMMKAAIDAQPVKLLVAPPTPDEVAALVKKLRDWIADADLSGGDLRYDWCKIVAQCSEAADALESLSPPAGMVGETPETDALNTAFVHQHDAYCAGYSSCDVDEQQAYLKMRELATSLERRLRGSQPTGMVMVPRESLSDDDRYWLEKLMHDVESPEQRPYIVGFSPMRLDFMARMLRRALSRERKE